MQALEGMLSKVATITTTDSAADGKESDPATAGKAGPSSLIERVELLVAAQAADKARIETLTTELAATSQAAASQATAASKAAEEAAAAHAEAVATTAVSHAAEVKALQQASATSAAEATRLKTVLEAKELQVTSLKTTVEMQTAALLAANAKADATASLLESEKEAHGQAVARADSAEAKVAELEQEARANEMLRKKLHNTIQELKGNIRVYCRI
eukprot:SAG31_NODE_11486_length_1025_cov_0.937365_1_plen_215_part_10